MKSVVILFLFLLLAACATAQRACTSPELLAGCGNFASSGTFSNNACRTCVCAASATVTLRTSGRTYTLANPFYPLATVGGNQTCGWWTQGDEASIYAYAGGLASPLVETVLFACTQPGPCENATAVCPPGIYHFGAQKCSAFDLPCDPLDVASRCSYPNNQCSKRCHHAFAPTTSTCFFNTGSCSFNASLPNPYVRNCTGIEIASACGDPSWVSSCTVSTLTNRPTCVCNPLTAVSGVVANADFPSPTQCMSLQSTYLPCTPSERWRCGPFYTRGCRVRVLWLSSAAFNGLGATPNKASWFVVDATNTGYYNRSTTDVGTSYARRVECMCSDTHDANKRFIRTDFSPSLYAGPDVLMVPNPGAAPFPQTVYPLSFCLVDSIPTWNGMDRAYIDNTIPTRRRTIQSLLGQSTAIPPYLSDISCGIDQFARLLTYGICPTNNAGNFDNTANPPDLYAQKVKVFDSFLNTYVDGSSLDQGQVGLDDLGENLLEWHQWALAQFTGRGDVPSQALGLAISFQYSSGSNGWFANLPPKPLNPTSYLYPDIETTNSATWNSPAEFYAFASQLVDNYPDRPQACNGIGSCNPMPAPNLTCGQNLESLKFQNRFNTLQPYFQWMHYNDFTRNQWITNPYEVLHYSALPKTAQFAKPNYLNQCSGGNGLCGGSNTDQNPTFFFGPRCSYFDCPGRITSSSNQIGYYYTTKAGGGCDVAVTQRDCDCVADDRGRYTAAYMTKCRIIATAIGGQCTPSTPLDLSANSVVPPLSATGCHAMPYPAGSTPACSCLTPTKTDAHCSNVFGTQVCFPTYYDCGCSNPCFQPDLTQPKCAYLPAQETRIPASFSARGPGLCGNGEFNFTLGNCQCDPGWTYESNSIVLGYGITCNQYICTAGLCIHGSCNATSAQCICNPGWTGPTCNQTLLDACNQATGSCSNHGYCDPGTGRCVCDSATYYTYNGTDCSSFFITSSDSCKNGGAWIIGQPNSPPYCACDPTQLYGGRFCEISITPKSIIDGTACTTSNGGTVRPPIETFQISYDPSIGLYKIQRANLRRGNCTCHQLPGYSTIRELEAADGITGSTVVGAACEYSIDKQADCINLGAVCSLQGGAPPSTYGRCVFDYNNTSPYPQKFGHCSCPPNLRAPYCFYTICDDPSLGAGLVNCNAAANSGIPGNNQYSGNQCVFFNSSAYGCQCGIQGNRLYQGIHCETEVTSVCGFPGTTNVVNKLCSGNGQCKNYGSAYACQCYGNNIGAQCQFTNCPASCEHGSCAPPSGSNAFYQCTCQKQWDNLDPTNRQTACMTLKCTGAIPTPDGNDCFCNNTLYSVSSQCTQYQCPGTSPYNERIQQCGPDFRSQSLVGTFKVDGSGATIFSYFEGGKNQVANTAKKCFPGTDECLCQGPFYTAPDGSCATLWDLNNTASFIFSDGQQTLSGTFSQYNEFHVIGATCVSGYDPSTYCKQPFCANGIYNGSACLCTLGYTGTTCSVDLCASPRGARNSTGGCVCTNSSYSGPWCQYSSCANGGTWDSNLFRCNCTLAYNGTNCSFSTCGPLGSPNITNGACNCSMNSTFFSGRGCVPDPQPICQNGGYAQNYRCYCADAWTGAFCNVSRCGSRGVWNVNEWLCDCFGLWLNNPDDHYNCTWSLCAPHGQPAPPSFTQCLCFNGFAPVAPNFTHCGKDCSGHGRVAPNAAACLCDNGYGGADCNIIVPYLNATYPNNTAITNATDYTALVPGQGGVTNNGTDPGAIPGVGGASGNGSVAIGDPLQNCPK